MAERKWTPAQKNAIEARSGTLLVSAAAGSGKTSVLTERIIRKLTGENPVRPESLLVVTFTNAAAAEMRSRIFAGIAALKAENPERRDEFTSLLSVLGEMQVCTMDSFAMRLVKENCHSLGIDADFNILDKGESQYLKKKTVIKVLERRFAEKSDTFLPLARMFESGKNDTNLIKTVQRLSEFSMSEAEPEKWLGQIHKMYDNSSPADSVWGKIILDDVKAALAYCIALYDVAIKEMVSDEEIAEQYGDFIADEKELVEEAVRALERGGWDYKLGVIADNYQRIYKDRKFPSKRGYGDNPVKISVKSKRDEAKSVFEDIMDDFNITEAENAEDMEILAPVAKELCETVIEYNKELLEAKKEIGSYDFSDISHFALSLLFDSCAPDGKTPLARELTAKYSEILIDEYQDTNRAQDALFHSVSDEGKNMFFVGDVKQSIYRFRLASPEIFIEKCNEFPLYDGNAEKSKIILGHNFRSRKGILDCVNFIFSKIMSPRCGEIEYNENERLNFPDGAVPSATTDVNVTVIECGEEKAFAAEARQIARTIRDCLDRGVTVGEGENERKAVASDFCILMRSPSGIAHFYVKELEKAGIPLASSINLSYFETPEIKTVMSYLRVLDNPIRDTDLLTIMLSPLFGFTADDVTALRLKTGRYVSLYATVMQGKADGDKKCIALLEKLDRFRKLAACSPVGDVIREIYDDTSFVIAAGAMKNGEKRRENLKKLLEMAEHCPESSTTLSGFVRYIEILRENESDVSVVSSADGVRFMTMHGSKGLEFPFVFIAGSAKLFVKKDLYGSLIINHNAGLGIQRREPEMIKKYDTIASTALRKINNNEMISEFLRVYYVGLTRAKQKLFIMLPLKNHVARIGEAEGLISGFDTVPSYLINGTAGPMKWLLWAFALHPEGRSFRKFTSDDPADVKAVRFEFVSDEDGAADDVPEAEKASADEDMIALIKEKAGFTYKWADIAGARSKHTASSIDEEHFDAADFGKSVPAFMFSSSMSPVDIGTATHRFLQFCDFDSCRKSVEAECERLVKNGRLTEKQASGVDAEAINHFVSSEILARAEKSRAMYREKQFTMTKSICELDSTISEEFADEKTVIIGKIDLLFIEDDGAVIVDYKTDKVSDVAMLGSHYGAQMKLYSEALEKSMGLKVKECILYSLKLRDSICLKF